MIKIIKGSFTSGIHELVLDKIRELISKKEHSFLIVPEQHTLSLEKESSAQLPSDAPLYFEATNFTRFANTVFRSLGGVAGEHSDRTRRALVMWEALTALSENGELKILKTRSGVTAGLVTKAIAALNEAESFGADTETLRETAKALEGKNPRLASKLSDLAALSERYFGLLLEKYGDTGDELSALCEKLRENPDFLRGVRIFIEGFTSFTEPQYKLIGLLGERAELTVLLNVPKSAPDAFEYAEPRFTEARLKKLGAVLDKFYDGAFGVKSAHLYELSKSLFKAEAKLSEEPDGSVRIFEAKTPTEECIFAAEDIKRRVIEGASYSDFLIVARHAESYIGTLDDALKKSGLPHFFAKPSPITSFEGARHVISAITAISSHFSREELINYMKSGFSGVDRGACDEFELYAETWQLNERHFLTPDAWDMSPDGFDSRKSDGATEKLSRINETKALVLEPLISLKMGFDEAKTVLDFATALLGFIRKTKLSEKIDERAKKLYSIGETEAAEENAALFEIIIDSLDTLVEAAGSLSVSLDSFREMLTLVFSEASISRIPSFKEQITVGSADSIRRGAKNVYIIGANSGEFPALPSDSAFFSDKEKNELKALDIHADTSTEYDYARELFYFARVCSSASESLTILYSATSFAFKSQKPSEPVLRILKLAPEKLFARKISSIPLDERVYSKSSAISLSMESERLREGLSKLGFSEELDRIERSVENSSLSLTKDLAAAIYGGEFKLSQSEIDKFIDCPLAHFCNYAIKLSSDEKAEFNARNVGSFIHAILEKFFNEAENYKKRGVKISEIPPEERVKIAKAAAEEYLYSISGSRARSGRERHMTERLEKTAIPVIEELCDEFSECDFEAKFTELRIKDGARGLPSPIKFELADGSFVKIGGIIDRVDSYKSGDKLYVRVIDYKTGAKEFSREDLDEGRNIQMFLYLKSLIDSRDAEFLSKIGAEGGEKLIPAGVIYVKNEFGDVKIKKPDEKTALIEFKKKQDRRGMVLADEESLSAMNKDFLPVTVSSSKNATGNIIADVSDATKKFLYTEEEFDGLIETVRNSVSRVAMEMKEGALPARPMKNKKKSPCEYCKYKPICRRDFSKK